MTPNQQYEADCEAVERLRDQRIMEAGLTLRQAQWTWIAAQAGYEDSLRRADALRDYGIDQAGEKFNKALDRARLHVVR